MSDGKDLFWQKIQALTTLQQTLGEQIDRLHELTVVQSETAQLQNETLREARADRLADILNDRLDRMLREAQRRGAAYERTASA